MSKNSSILQTKSGFPEENTITENKNSATIKVSDAARILNIAPQTVRLLLQMGAVSWGIAYKLPRSRHFSYLIYAEKLYKEIGIGGDARC